MALQASCGASKRGLCTPRKQEESQVLPPSGDPSQAPERKVPQASLPQNHTGVQQSPCRKPKMQKGEAWCPRASRASGGWVFQAELTLRLWPWGLTPAPAPCGRLVLLGPGFSVILHPTLMMAHLPSSSDPSRSVSATCHPTRQTQGPGIASTGAGTRAHHASGALGAGCEEAPKVISAISDGGRRGVARPQGHNPVLALPLAL